MYKKAYGIIETLAPVHIGASAGEETGNLNLIFRDQFTQTGIIPGSSIRGRFRADMRNSDWKAANDWYGHESEADEEQKEAARKAKEEGKPLEQSKDRTTEALVKFEYASILWLPVYCPNQPVVRVSCPRLLRRYQRITGKAAGHQFTPYSYYSPSEQAKLVSKTLFFNLGFLPLQNEDKQLKNMLPDGIEEKDEYTVLVVEDAEISMIHDMALYRQSRVALDLTQKKAKKGAFFDVEALPEGTILTFPLALKPTDRHPDLWTDFCTAANMTKSKDLYFGGLESIGFGRTKVMLNQYSEGE